MKKIGIVSCYFKHNYGSMLQSYATQKVLDNLGYENETINIDGFNHEISKAKKKYFIKAAFTSNILSSKIGMVKNVVLKKNPFSEYAENAKIRDNKFNSFQKSMYKLSEKYESKDALGLECQTKYGAIIVGSDQLWLPANIAGDYYTLNFVPESVNTISYSTSFGQSQLPDNITEKAETFLKKIRYIGVREEAGKKLIKKICGREVQVVCDPTLLLNADEWMKIQPEEPIIKQKYILCYFLGKNEKHRKFASRLKSLTNTKIVALNHLDEYIKSDDSYADETPYDIGPSEFLNLIRNATYICSDSYHCAIFSMIFKNEFFSFKRYSDKCKQSTNSRLETLLNSVGIFDRLLSGDENVEECIHDKINYDEVQSSIDAIKNKSLVFLTNALEDKKVK
ncbi:MAG: polysaccharide pyruvyl transferase family protein [Erysipelotrichaceae bacterium]